MLLRGSEGFGRPHRLRTDRLLSLSEDLPIVSIAIDRRERIEATLERVLRDQGQRPDHPSSVRACSRGKPGRCTCPRARARPPSWTVYLSAPRTRSQHARVRRDLSAAAPPRNRRRERAARRRRHTWRAPLPRALLQPQRQRSHDRHRSRRRPTDHPGAARADESAERAAANTLESACASASATGGCSPRHTSCRGATSAAARSGSS